MISLAFLVVLVGVAVAAPQAAYKPLAAPYKPAAYTVAARGYFPYATPRYPYATPSHPYATPSYLSATPSYPYAAPVYPSAAPLAKATPYASPEYAYPYPQYVKPVAILRQSQDDNFDGSFTYDFQAENGVASQASGFLKNAGTEDEAQVIQGQYSYTAPDGTPIVTQYFADETGFHVQGEHLPVAPADPFRTA